MGCEGTADSQHHSVFVHRQRAHIDETVLDAGSHPISERLDRYRAAVDEVVLRAITPTDSLDDYLSFVSEAKSLL